MEEERRREREAKEDEKRRERETKEEERRKEREAKEEEKRKEREAREREREAKVWFHPKYPLKKGLCLNLVSESRARREEAIQGRGEAAQR